MNLVFKHFRKEHYSDYASWFADAELNRHLGPMGNDWLQAVLTQPDSEGVTWAIFLNDQLVAVAETVFDRSGQLPAGIPAIAVKPSLRRRGIGTMVLHTLLSMHKERGITEHLAYASETNVAAQELLKKNGFASTVLNDHGYREYRHSDDATITTKNEEAQPSV